MKRNLFLNVSGVVLIFAIVALLTVIPAERGKTGRVSLKKNQIESPVETTAPSEPLVQSTTLVISQAYGGGGGASGTYSADYVEIKNISGVAQSLNTLSIMYGSATGQFGSSAGNIQALPNRVLAPGQYFLLQLGTVGSGGAAVPSPDLINGSTNMAAASGKVALVTSSFAANTCGATATPCTLPNANIIDLVSWGASNNAEGGIPTNGGAALTATQGNVRKGAGCTDTDNNNLDFDIITAPVPRNSTSTRTPCVANYKSYAPADFNGDGRTDLGVIRLLAGPGLQFRWYILFDQSGQSGDGYQADWGAGLQDFNAAADYDGDGKDDIAIWRKQGATTGFYILQSSTGTFRYVQFGLPVDTLDVGDYDGDGKDDPAIYRAGPNNTQSTFWWLGSAAPNAGVQFPVQYGLGDDTAVPGDYNGDGKADFCVYRDLGVAAGHQNAFFVHPSTGGSDATGTSDFSALWGITTTDSAVPGDYDGDGKTDFAVTRVENGQFVWYILPSSGAPAIAQAWGLTADLQVQGDYDGDGKTDIAVYRFGNPSAFFFIRSSNGTFGSALFGIDPDVPIINDTY